MGKIGTNATSDKENKSKFVIWWYVVDFTCNSKFISESKLVHNDSDTLSGDRISQEILDFKEYNALNDLNLMIRFIFFVFECAIDHILLKAYRFYWHEFRKFLGLSEWVWK